VEARLHPPVAGPRVPRQALFGIAVDGHGVVVWAFGRDAVRLLLGEVEEGGDSRCGRGGRGGKGGV